jgi:hypothetical protein
LGAAGVAGALAPSGVAAAACAYACWTLPRVDPARNATLDIKANERLKGKRMVAAIKHPHKKGEMNMSINIRRNDEARNHLFANSYCI